MKQGLILAVLLVVFVSARAQQDPQFTQWMFDQVSFNPGAAGINGMHCVSMFYRDQWDGFDRDPKTGLFNYQGRVGSMPIGVGLSLFRESLGQERNTMFKVSGNYQLPIGSNVLSAGLSLGGYQKLLGNQWIAIDPVSQDNAINDDERSATSFDLGLGVMFANPGKYYAGLSATHLTGQDLKDLNIKMTQHIYIMGGYNFDLTSSLKLRSNLLAKSDLNVMTFDLNANVLWNDMVWAGVSYRLQDAIAPMAGFQMSWVGGSGYSKIPQKVMLGYSYDATTSEIRTYSAGSHEIFVTYCFNIISNPPQNRHANPRFL
ncbi:MAG: type IX secretion system membrane protein PorP/SprF [Flavobacteriales bacterium]|nr:type IX secretion system membrane protein PorP/SprF [Flavobacteriales bacterium]